MSLEDTIRNEIRTAIEDIVEDKELLTWRELCDRAKISRGTLNQLVRDGLPHYKAGGKKYLWSDFIKFVKQ